ncbi:hypothetical protein ILUMI_15583 [Ignelater luminosus]|uniref:C2H2-type domain-containing protein n=1 Tax=Ignelater luminosus TaxID=2038154 RepID=A0A8K0CW74_IGNLU|nr:hypothetical protein ILUMI_15583 [Ignelater luminosus]
MGKQDEDWKNLREAWNKVDKSHNWYSRLLTWWSKNKHDQKIVLEKITALKNQSNCPTSLQKWIFKSATTSTKTTATSEPARSSNTVATTQPPTSSNNVEQAKEVEELPSKPPTSANTPVQNRLKSEIADLTLKIKKLQDFVSYNISRTELYYRLIPRNVSTKDGRRHVNTVPVKLIRPSNSLRKEHEDTHFCAGQIKHIRDLVELLGPQAVNMLSVDDKARVPLGLPAAQKQAPILMRYERQILMPDHDYPIVKGLKLIPSVIGVLCFKDWKVSYSGPTCISIREVAIDSSTAETHRQDLIKYLHHDKMRDYFWSNNRIKPVLVVFSDGGPDKAPRNEKVLQAAVKSFKMLDLDAMFVCTNAPHQSARNPVERRMAPLSRDLCGLIIPHDVCGTHLDARGRTIDKVLEKKNFEAAERILAESYDFPFAPVLGRRIFASSSHVPPWLVWSRSLFSGNYGRPVLRHFAKAPKRFLGSSQTMSRRLLLPVGDSRIAKLICPVCKKYFFRKASLTKHGKIHKNLATIFELAEEEIETEVVSSIDEGGVQIIEDMEALMQPIYVDDTGN